jgi:hypothetical protein
VTVQSFFNTEAEVLASKTGNLLRASSLLQRAIFVDPQGKSIFDLKGEVYPQVTQINMARLNNFRRAQSELPISAALKIYESDVDLIQFDRHLAAADYLFDSSALPFETLEETEIALRALVKNLSDNTESLISSGLPDSPLWNSSTWWQNCTRVYPTEIPFERTLKNSKTGLKYRYSWAKKNGNVVLDLDQKTKSSIKELRKLAIRVAIETLNEALDAIQKNNSDYLLQNTARRIASHPDLKPLLKVDGQLESLDTKGIPPIKGYSQSDRIENSLTLTRLLQIVAHIDAEIRTKVISTAKKEIGNILSNITNETVKPSYFYFAAFTNISKVDRVIDNCLEKFPTRQRLLSVLEPRPNESGDLFNRFSVKEREGLKAIFDDPSFHDWLVRATKGREIDAIKGTDPASILELIAQNVFIKVSRGTWKIKFLGEDIFIKTQKGLEYIYKILTSRPSALRPSDLEGKSVPRPVISDAPEVSTMPSASDFINGRVRSVGNPDTWTGPLADYQTIKECRDRLTELSKKKPRTFEDNVEFTAILEYLKLRKIEDKDGKREKSASEKQRKAVNKALDDARKSIKRESVDIEKHFKVSLLNKHGYTYAPSPDQEWLT